MTGVGGRCWALLFHLCGASRMGLSSSRGLEFPFSLGLPR